MSYNPASPNGQANMANSKPVVIASDQSVVPVDGATASGASLTNPPVTTGGLAKTALPSAVSDGQVVNRMHDKFGRQVVVNGTIRDLVATQTTTISNSTSSTTIVSAGGSGVFTDISSIIISNTSASTNTRVDVSDGTRTYGFMSIGGSGPVGASFQVPLPATTANTAWTATCATATTDIRISVVYLKNQ